MMKTSLYAALALVAVTLGTTRLDAQPGRARLPVPGRALRIAFHNESMTITRAHAGQPAHRGWPATLSSSRRRRGGPRIDRQVADTPAGSPLLLRVVAATEEADSIVAARDFCLRIVADTVAAGT